MDATVAERQETGLRARIARHPISAFLLLVLGSVYLLSLIPILMQYDVIPGRSLPTSSRLLAAPRKLSRSYRRELDELQPSHV